MSQKFWDSVAENFDTEIFNTLRNDRTGVIRDRIARFGSKDAFSADFGCGIGRYLKLLAERSQRVYAIDISSKCLSVAQRTCRHFDNIVYIAADLAYPNLRIAKVDLAISINVLIMPSYEKRLAILRGIVRRITDEGSLLLIVPSLESALYSSFMQSEWRFKSRSRRALGNPCNLGKDGNETSVTRGLLKWSGVITKHYLREELMILLAKLRLQVLEISKVEYSWKASFESPPSWMKEPYPWDWMVLCKKTRRGEASRLD